MSDSKIYWQALALKNAGARIQRMIEDGVTGQTLRLNQREVLRQGAKFLRSLIGEPSLPKMSDSSFPTAHIGWYLRVIDPLLPDEGLSPSLWETVIDECTRMPFGDEPDLLRPEPRKPGQPSQPALVAMRRVRALEWAEYFQAHGIRPKYYQPAISLSFGADWDSVRHWRTSASKTLGDLRVERILRDARDGYFIRQKEWHSSPIDPLWADGVFYRKAVGITELTHDSFHIKLEDLAPILSILRDTSLS